MYVRSYKQLSTDTHIISTKNHDDHVAANTEDVEVDSQKKTDTQKEGIEPDGSGAGFSTTEFFLDDPCNRLDEK